MSLCAQHTHIVTRLADGGYICVQCGLQFREYHELHVHGSTVSMPTREDA